MQGRWLCFEVHHPQNTVHVRRRGRTALFRKGWQLCGGAILPRPLGEVTCVSGYLSGFLLENTTVGLFGGL